MNTERCRACGPPPVPRAVSDAMQTGLGFTITTPSRSTATYVTALATHNGRPHRLYNFGDLLKIRVEPCILN